MQTLEQRLNNFDIFLTKPVDLLNLPSSINYKLRTQFTSIKELVCFAGSLDNFSLTEQDAIVSALKRFDLFMRPASISEEDWLQIFRNVIVQEFSDNIKLRHLRDDITKFDSLDPDFVCSNKRLIAKMIIENKKISSDEKLDLLERLSTYHPHSDSDFIQ